MVCTDQVQAHKKHLRMFECILPFVRGAGESTAEPQQVCLAEFPGWRGVRHLGCGEMLTLGAFSLRKVHGSSVEPKSRQSETLSGVTVRA